MKIKWLIIIGVKSQGGRIALKEEDGLFGPMRKLRPHWVTLCLLFSSEGVR